jgi:hypothetical protein
MTTQQLVSLCRHRIAHGEWSVAGNHDLGALAGPEGRRGGRVERVRRNGERHRSAGIFRQHVEQMNRTRAV